MPRNCVAFLLLCEPTWSTILWSQQSGSTKWRTMPAPEVKGKPHNFKAFFSESSYYSTFKTSFQPYSFPNKCIHMLFIAPNLPSKGNIPFGGHATCFNIHLCLNMLSLRWLHEQKSLLLAILPRTGSSPSSAVCMKTFFLHKSVFP